MGGDIPRKGGPEIKKSDLLVINKMDLAEYVDVNLEQMKIDVENARDGMPFIFGEMKHNNGEKYIIINVGDNKIHIK